MDLVSPCQLCLGYNNRFNFINFRKDIMSKILIRVINLRLKKIKLLTKKDKIQYEINKIDEEIFKLLTLQGRKHD